MAASIIRRPRPGTKSEAILTLTATTPASPAEIAETVNTSRQLVHQVMDRYGIIPNRSESYKEHRADILAGMQERILATVDEAAIKQASLMQRSAAFGILYDKERTERGLSDSAVKPMVVIQIKGDNTRIAVDNSPDNVSAVVQSGGK